MTKLFRLIGSIVVVFGLTTMPVKADWGFAVGVKGHSGDIETEGSEREGNSLNENQNAGSDPDIEIHKKVVSEATEIGSIFVEVAGREGPAGVTFGFDYIPGSASIGAQSRTDTDAGDATGEADTGTYTAKAEVDNLITFYVEPTFYLGDFGLYAKGGVTHMDVNTLESIADGTDSSTYPNEKVWGGVLGGGIRYTHSSGFLVKLEYTDTNFQALKLDSTTGNRNRIKADIDYTATTLAIGWQF